jgi:hypothetical protein
MRKSTIAIGIAAALSTPAFVASTNADAAAKIKPSKASGPTHQSPHFKYPNRHSPSGGNVLYDQSGTPANGFPSQNFSSTYDQYDAAGADDFVVGDAAGWDVSAFNFQISVGDPSTATYDIDVYPDAGGLPGGSTVCSYDAIPGVVDGSLTSLSVALPTTCHLPPGTYWVSMIGNLDFFAGGQIFWSGDFRTGLGSNAAWENPGGGFGIGCTTWTDNTTCGAGSGMTAAEFQVIGAVGGGGGDCGAGDLCLVSTVGTDTSPGACGTSDTIDATVGDQLNFCYTITNNTGVELDYHTLENNVDGTLFSLLNQPVPNGGTFQYNHIETVSQSNTYNSTWTGQDVPPGYAAEVTTGGGGGDCSDRIFADGFDGTPLPCPGGEGGFIDISSTGTPLGLSDDGSADVTMPFSFTFYGTTSNLLSVNNNGGVIFGASGAGLPFTNVSLPAASLLGPAILPLWDDFDSEAGNVYTDIRGTAPNRQFIVEWYQRVHYFGNSDSATFEIILNEGDGSLQFEYADVDYTAFGNVSCDPDVCDGGVCATIGLQSDPTLFNQFSAFEASVQNDTGIKWTPTSPQVFTGSDTVTVNVGAPSIVVNNGNPITGTVPAGGTNSVQFPIANTGNRDLNWSLTEAGPADMHFPPPGTRFAPMLGDPSRATTRPVPVGLRNPGAKPYHPLNAPIHGPGTVPMFAADIYNNQFVTLDALNPGTVNVVASTDGTPWTGGAFIDGDFSKLYVLSGSFGANPDQFATIDTATGAKTVIGSTPSPGGAGWNGMAYDSTTGTMYAVTGCPSGSSLYTIDINTGTPTLVGSLANEACTVSIAIDSAGQMFGVDIVNDALYAIDKTNANDSLIGSIGFNANYAQEMTFDLSTDVLYYAAFNLDLFGDFMYTVDTGTGATSLIGQITGGFAELDGMGIETAGGPCAQPQDLPWLSLSPLTGTTAPGGSTPVTASLNGAGQSDGDTLSGTVCATSNDPNNRTVATPINVTVGTGGGTIVDSGVLNTPINADITGLYINWLTGHTCTSDDCSATDPTFDFNPYNSGGMIFWWSGQIAATSRCVVSGSACAALTAGTSIGPSSTFGAGSSANFTATGGTQYLGFTFVNTNTSQVNYGYAKLQTTAGTGFPATLVEYWYDNSGAPITIQ